jgi:hypothetical protein
MGRQRLSPLICKRVLTIRLEETDAGSDKTTFIDVIAIQ